MNLRTLPALLVALTFACAPSPGGDAAGGGAASSGGGTSSGGGASASGGGASASGGGASASGGGASAAGGGASASGGGASASGGGASASGGGASASGGGASASGGGASASGGGASDAGVFAPRTFSRSATDDLLDWPQYLTVRKSGTELPDQAEKARCEALLPALAGKPFVGNAHTCVIFNAYVVDSIPDRATRIAVLEQGFREPAAMIGQAGAGHRRLAVEVFLDLLDVPLDRLEVWVTDLLEAARRARTPVIFVLDAVNWWGARPDLWNFYDPAKPGYAATNVNNVEWTGDTAQDATKVFWRNWGSQIRVETPVPDLAGKGFRDAVAAALDRVMPPIRDFERRLGPDEKELFGGLTVGTEVSIGVNHYHYPNGNQYLGQDSKCDPGLPHVAGCPTGAGACAAKNHGLCEPDFTNGTLNGGVAQLGFKASLDLGLRTAGQPMTRTVLDAIVTDYLAFVNHQLLVVHRMPQHKLYSHMGGTYGGSSGPHSYSVARYASFAAGWSLYFGDAQAVAFSGVGGYLKSSGSDATLPWSTPEWLPYVSGSASQASWYGALENTLNFLNNRMLAVANWEGVGRDGAFRAAVAQSLVSPRLDACTVVPRVVIGSADFAGTTGVRITRAVAGTATFFVASTSPLTNGRGGLATIDVANVNLGNDTSFFFSGAPRDVYVQVVTDGCARDGVAQRVLSPIVPLRVGGSGQAPSGVRLFAQRGEAPATNPWVALSWEVPAAAILAGHVAYLNVSTDPTFATIDVHNEAVTQSQLVVRDGLAGKTSYARLVVDTTENGQPKRLYSNTLTLPP